MKYTLIELIITKQTTPVASPVGRPPWAPGAWAQTKRHDKDKTKKGITNKDTTNKDISNKQTTDNQTNKDKRQNTQTEDKRQRQNHSS